MTQQAVTVVVINWKLKEKTLNCLRSLQQVTTPLHIILVDNGSNDGSAKAFRQQCPHVELIALPENIGFSAACNLAIARAQQNGAGDYIFLLNNDTVVHPRVIEELLEIAALYPDGGIFGPKIYYRKDPNRVWYAGARRRRAVLAAADTGRGMLDRGQLDKVRDVDYIFGAAMLIDSRVFEKIGLLDERFFIYLEDLDFCLRAQADGFPIVFVPRAHVWHDGSASTDHDIALRRSYLVESTFRFLKKHTSLITLVPILIFWFLVFLRSAAADLLRGDLATLRSYWRGLRTGMVGEGS